MHHHFPSIYRCTLNAQSELADTLQNYRVSNIASVLLYLLRMLAVIKFQPRLGLISSTLAAAAKDLMHWSIIFLMIMVI